MQAGLLGTSSFSESGAVSLRSSGQSLAKQLAVKGRLGACGYNGGHACAQQYVGKSHSCMVQNGRLIPHAS